MSLLYGVVENLNKKIETYCLYLLSLYNEEKTHRIRLESKVCDLERINREREQNAHDEAGFIKREIIREREQRAMENKAV